MKIAVFILTQICNMMIVLVLDLNQHCQCASINVSEKLKVEHKPVKFMSEPCVTDCESDKNN